MLTKSTVTTGEEIASSGGQVDHIARETRTKNVVFSILVAISVIGLAIFAVSYSQHVPQDSEEYTPTTVEYIAGFMFVIPILTLMIVYVRKYGNEITCCMIASLLACFAMGATGTSETDKEEQERKRREGMAWEEQEQRRKN
jgi:uncharacterized protein with PQ loop repeat